MLQCVFEPRTENTPHNRVSDSRACVRLIFVRGHKIGAGRKDARTESHLPKGTVNLTDSQITMNHNGRQID